MSGKPTLIESVTFSAENVDNVKTMKVTVKDKDGNAVVRDHPIISTFNKSRSSSQSGGGGVKC